MGIFAHKERRREQIMPDKPVISQLAADEVEIIASLDSFYVDRSTLVYESELEFEQKYQAYS
jgi:hypothetical protein